MGEYAPTWVAERGLSATTDELYRRLLRLHVLPVFGALNLDEDHPAGGSLLEAERLAATGATTVAKSYRLLKAITEIATDDELVRRNPCRIKGAGSEKPRGRLVWAVSRRHAFEEAMPPVRPGR
ncbi:hypothetical protein [Streptomyces peucetius]|uniref:hypothetical protein n=1 Tax=Streptomyces peucetius TaxID=1950 RepID=UPI0039AF464F